MFRFYLFTDTHIAARAGDVCPSASAQALDASIDIFLADPDCGTLLISGDLTENGHADEHRAMLERLRRIHAAGKRVYVITATHDYGLGYLETCPDDGAAPLDRPDGKVYQSDLRGLYDTFGFRGNIAEYGGLSYVAQLEDGVRLLALNDDGDGRDFCGFDEPQMQWALEQIAAARRDGQVLLAMTHHPSLPPSPIYPLISRRDMLGNYEETTRRFADAGLRCLFTGHSHMHNIAPMTTPAGNPYWDINTACMGFFPGFYRVCSLEGRRLRAETRQVPDFPTLPDGISLLERYTKEFDFTMRDIIESADKDYDHFARSVGGMSVTPEQAYSLKFPLHLGGMVVNRITLGGLGRLLLCGGKIPKSIRKASFKELFLELVRNIFAGREIYGPDTDVGEAILAIAAQADKLIGERLPENLRPLPAFLGSLIYDPIPDDRIEIDV
ncbi:MAG: metallophosphoesterase [Oscillospiraceae bacterium]|jgi:hypothetical protein|nr:metallophosphoesterase [Oscillospiraceae bacterium]